MTCLPTGGTANGALCYVKGKDEVYTYINGVWIAGAHQVEKTGD